MIAESSDNAKPKVKTNAAPRDCCWSSACLCQSWCKSAVNQGTQGTSEALTGDRAREGLLLGMVLGGKAGLEKDPSIGWVTPVLPEETHGVTQGYLEWFLCFKGESVINLFLPPVVVEEGVADNSGAGEAGIEMESNLISGVTEQINFKPKTARERSDGELWSDAAGSCEPGELRAERDLTCS